MDVMNKPIEVVSQFSAFGDIIPLKMSLSDSNSERVSAKIGEILYFRRRQLSGIKTFDYGCKVLLGEKEQLLEIRYDLDSHRWTLRKGLCL